MLYLQVAALRYFTDVRSDAQRGATLIEYALLVAFIAIVCIAAVTLLGGSVSGQFSEVHEPFKG